jgi:hypothetical protein
LEAWGEYLARRIDEIPDEVAGNADAEWLAESLAAWYLDELRAIEREMGRRSTRKQPGYLAPQRVTASFAADLKQELPLPEFLVAHISGTQLREAGDHHVGLCLFHEEDTPSFHVWADHAHCFGCGWHGDVFDLLRESGVSWRRAVEAVAAYLGRSLPPPLTESESHPTPQVATGRAARQLAAMRSA